MTVILLVTFRLFDQIEPKHDSVCLNNASVNPKNTPVGWHIVGLGSLRLALGTRVSDSHRLRIIPVGLN